MAAKGLVFDRQRIFTSTIRADGPGTPTPADLAAIRKLAMREVSAGEVYCFPAVISNSEMDTYFTAMSATTLANFAADARAGVGLLVNHRTNPYAGGIDLPYGRSFAAELRPAATGGQQVVARFYLLRGYAPNIGQVGTDELIKGLEGGLLFDISVGFKPGQGSWWRCSVCGEDILSASCPHLPGKRYNDGALCFAWAEGFRLSECSLVFDGSTPLTGVLVGERSAQRGGWQRWTTPARPVPHRLTPEEREAGWRRTFVHLYQ